MEGKGESTGKADGHEGGLRATERDGVRWSPDGRYKYIVVVQMDF